MKLKPKINMSDTKNTNLQNNYDEEEQQKEMSQNTDDQAPKYHSEYHS